MPRKWDNTPLEPQYDMWTVVGEVQRVQQGKSHCLKVRCRCACGKEKDVALANLRSRKSRSCGCLRDKLTGKRARTHGGTGTKLYGVWARMCDRCRNQKNRRWKDYGGRGIKVCPQWESSFATFAAWAHANGYAEGLTLDRKNTNGNYEESNCRWVGWVTQANNRRSNHLVTYQEETKSIADWARDERCVVPRRVLQKRIQRFGWDMRRALTAPTREVGLSEAELQKRRKARCAVSNAIKGGRLVRPGSCQYPGCNNIRTEAHHHKGYERESWLDVVWLCRAHHEMMHHDIDL